MAEQIATLTAAGIPVMAHIGFTPQSVNSLGGFRVQGRGDAAEQTIHDAIAVAEGQCVRGRDGDGARGWPPRSPAN